MLYEHIPATTADRGKAGATIIATYRAGFDPSEYPPEEGASATQSALGDLLADLMHAADHYPEPGALDFDTALDMARIHHAAEVAEEADEPECYPCPQAAEYGPAMCRTCTPPTPEGDPQP